MKIVKLICKECGKAKNRVSYYEKYKCNLCYTCFKGFEKFPFHHIPPAGEIHYDEEGRILCHICGRGFNSLTPHLRDKHGMTKDEYKEQFGLNRGTSLVSEKTKEKLRQSEGCKNINEKRGPLFQKGHTMSKKPRRLQTYKGKNDEEK